MALAANAGDFLRAQARYHGTPIHAANLCASSNYEPRVRERDAMAAMDVLERTQGRAINDWIARSAGSDRLDMGREIGFDGPDLSVLTG